MTTLLVILSLLGTAPNDPAPAAARDVLRCDFEDGIDCNYDGWPDGWTREFSRDLPEFLKVGIVAETNGSSASPQRPNHCLQIELDGGGAVVVSPPCPVSSQFSLALTLRVKTAGLNHDCAWVELTLQDAAGQTIETHATPPLTHCPDWQQLHLGPLQVNKNVAQLVVTLHVRPRGKREDLTGQVWFDDLKIERLPRMQLIASSPTGIYLNRQLPELTCIASGIRVRNPRVRFDLIDHLHQIIETKTIPLLTPQDAAKWAAKALPPDGYAGQAVWSPPLPSEPYGFYQVRAALIPEASETPLLDRTQTLAMLRPLPQPTRSEFGWTLPGGEEPLAYGPLATLLGQAGLGWAKMPVWYDPHETGKADRIAWFAEQLSLQGIELVGVLDQPPPELRAVFREQGHLPAASVFAEPELWQPALGPIMTRLSLKVHWWQLGNDSDVSFVGYPQLETKIASIKRSLEQYGQQIRLGVNWRWVYDAPPASGQRGAPWSFLSYAADPALTAEETGAYLSGLQSQPEAKAASAAGRITSAATEPLTHLASATPRRSSGPRSWMLLSPLSRGEYSGEARVQDLVQRMLAAKINGAQAIFLPQPLNDNAGIMNLDASPGELFLPWRTTAMLIGGTEYLGPVQLPAGTTGHVFARDGRAVLAVWSDRPTIERVYLGEDVQQIDVWGRSTKPPLREQDGRMLHEIAVAPSPTFITGLSEAVARWQAGLVIENPQLSSIAGREQLVMMRVQNTFPQSVSGELRILAPKSWGADARPIRFKIAEGDTLRLPLPITLLADANSGAQPVRLDFDISGYRFSVHRTLTLGLDDVQVEMTSRLRKSSTGEVTRSDLIVELHLTNLAERPLGFQCVLFAPGRRRETRQIKADGHDRTTLTYILPDGESLVGNKLWLRAEEIGGSRVLNYTLVAER